MSSVEHQVGEDQHQMRLDRFLKTHYSRLPQALIEKLLRHHRIRVNGHKTGADFRLKTGDTVWIGMKPERKVLQSSPASIPEKWQTLFLSSVVYRDEALLVMNKPNGLAVQGGSRQRISVDSLLEVLEEAGGRLVHRLDKETSGLLIIARTRQAAKKLGEMFKERKIEKTYCAVVKAIGEKGQQSLAAGQTGEMTQAIADYKRGRVLPALTRYQQVRRRGDMVLLTLSPLTGRKHQIRRHCAGSGLAIIGDTVYMGLAGIQENQDKDFFRQHPLCLHASTLCFAHPFTGNTLRVEAPLPVHMQKWWQEI